MWETSWHWQVTVDASPAAWETIQVCISMLGCGNRMINDATEIMFKNCIPARKLMQPAVLCIFIVS